MAVFDIGESNELADAITRLGERFLGVAGITSGTWTPMLLLNQHGAPYASLCFGPTENALKGYLLQALGSAVAPETAHIGQRCALAARYAIERAIRKADHLMISIRADGTIGMIDAGKRDLTWAVAALRCAADELEGIVRQQARTGASG